MSFPANLRRFLICFTFTECAVMGAWALVATATGDNMSIESFLVLTAITSAFVAVSGLAIGLPLAFLAVRAGWASSGVPFKLFGGLAGGIAAYLMTLLFFIDGLDVGFAMARITAWFGAFAGLVAAICWQRLTVAEQRQA